MLCIWTLLSYCLNNIMALIVHRCTCTCILLQYIITVQYRSITKSTIKVHCLWQPMALLTSRRRERGNQVNCCCCCCSPTWLIFGAPAGTSCCASTTSSTVRRWRITSSRWCRERSRCASSANTTASSPSPSTSQVHPPPANSFALCDVTHGVCDHIDSQVLASPINAPWFLFQIDESSTKALFLTRYKPTKSNKFPATRKWQKEIQRELSANQRFLENYEINKYWSQFKLKHKAWTTNTMIKTRKKSRECSLLKHVWPLTLQVC